MIIKLPIQDMLNLELHNFNSEDKSSFKELRDFFMQAPVPLAILKGRDHFFTLSNLPYETMIGRSAMGKNLLEVFTKDEIGHLLPILDSVYLTGVPYVGKDIPLNLAGEDGIVQPKWMDVAYHPFRENDEEVIKGIFAVFQDVTDRVIAKKIVSKSEEKFKQLANTLPQMVWTATAEGKLDWYNDVWFNYTGADRNLSVDEGWSQAIHPDEVKKVVASWYAAVNSGDLYREEIRFKNALTGEYRWHMNQGGAIKNEFGEIEKWTGSCTDIHEQKMAFQMLEQERDIRDKFVTALSHDLRTPLAAAKISAQLLVRKVPEHALLLRAATRIVANMDRADNMIQDILDASLIKTGEKIALEIVECNLREVIETTAEELTSLHGDRIYLELDENIVGLWDHRMIRRMIENLVNNAVKYGSELTPITIYLKRTNEMVEIAVHNVGNPIDLRDQKGIFEPNHRTASATNGIHKGWGIGLTLVRGFAEAHGGKAIVTSSATEGTKFSIFIREITEGRTNDHI